LVPYLSEYTSTGAGCSGCSQIDFAALLKLIPPLLPRLASGVLGNIPLAPHPLEDDWKSFVAQDYENRPQGVFPRLDSGTELGPLELKASLAHITKARVPNLPKDPMATDGRTFDAMYAMVLANPAGFGLVPLGVGLGLDCTEPPCTDYDPKRFDGQVNELTVCNYTIDPTLNECPLGFDEPRIPRGHLGIFSTEPHSGLEGSPLLTVVLSSSLTSIGYLYGQRMSGYIVRSSPNATNLQEPSFPTFVPFVNGEGCGRKYQAQQTSGIDVHLVSFLAPGSDHIPVKWYVYYAGKRASYTFHAPQVPLSADPMDDPFSPTALYIRDPKLNLKDTHGAPLEAPVLDITHVGFSLTQEHELRDYLEHRERTLAHLTEDVTTFSLRNSFVLWKNSCN